MVDENNKKCERCQDFILNDNNECSNCKRMNQVHEDVQSFIKKLQEAQEATRKHNTYFGPLPNEDKPLIKNITTTTEEMDETIRRANIVVKNIPPWKIPEKYNDHPLYKKLTSFVEDVEKLRQENEFLREKIKVLQEKLKR